MKLKRKPKGDKIYRGAYNYYKGQNLYSEETFEVYKERSDMGLTFFAALHGRVPTGELLNIYVDYQVNKDFIPQALFIEKSLGKESVSEVYKFHYNSSKLEYRFISEDEEKECLFSVPTKFTINTPCTSTSMLYFRTKKFDPNSKNLYQVVSSPNLWNFQKRPSVQTLELEKMGQTSNLTIDGKNLQADGYKLFDPEVKQTTGERDHIKCYLSKYNTIPYLIETADQTKIQIKYLNNLDRDAS